MKTINLKDKLTTYAALAFGICVAILALPTTIAAIAPEAVFTMPAFVNVICGVVIALSIIITQVLTGKNPDGTSKNDPKNV
jgi:hypothetical protein